MEINIEKKVKVQAKTLKVCGKTSDCCCVTLVDQDGQELKYHDGYVPKGLGIGGGDYIEFDVDLDTGQILNWKKPTVEVVEEFIRGEE